MLINSTLQILNEHCNNVINHILADEIDKVPPYLDKIRLYRSTIRTDFKSSVTSDDFSKNLNEFEKIKPLLTEFKKKMNIIEEWLHRNDELYSYGELIETPEGIDYIIDAFLPLSWNFHKDLVFLFSDYGIKLIPNLVKRGQANIIYLTEKFESIPNVICIKNIDYFNYALLQLKRKPSLSVLIEPIKEDDEDAQEIISVQGEISKRLKILGIAQNTYQHFSKAWVEHKVKNLTNLIDCYSLNDFEEFIKDKPVIILNPGPSLSDDIEKIPSIRDNVIIIAPAQSCKALAKHKISPDFIIFIDAGDFSFYLDDLITERLKALILTDTVDPEFFNMLPNIPKVVLSTSDEFLATSDIVNQPNFEFTGGSVSVVALKIAVGLKAKAIGLMGQDLSVSNGSYYIEPNQALLDLSTKTYKSHHQNEQHIQENVEGPPLKKFPNGDVFIFYGAEWMRGVEIESNSGQKIVTFYDYWTFLIEIEEFLSNINGTKIYNFSKKGAKIIGADFMSFADFKAIFLKGSLPINKPLNEINIFERNGRRVEIKKKINHIKSTFDDYNLFLGRILKSIRQGKSKNLTLYQEELKRVSQNSPLFDLYLQISISKFISSIESKRGEKVSLKELYMFYESLSNEMKEFKKVMGFLNKNFQK